MIPSWRLPALLTGGLVGYFSYDYLGYSEPSIRVGVQDPKELAERQTRSGWILEFIIS